MSAQRCFEDLRVGLQETSPQRTVTQADVLAFAELSGDHNPLHTDPVHAAATTYGRPIAHGLLATSIASGLFTQTELSRSLQAALIALLGIECRFTRPVFAGDTLQVTASVSSLRDTRRADRGIAVVTRELINQRGECVQTAVTPLLLARLGHSPPTPPETRS